MLPVDLIERRLAALLPQPLRPPRARCGGESHNGNGPEMLGRSGEVAFAGVLEEEDGPKSHLKLKNPVRPLAFLGGGGDMHELGSCS